MDTGVFEYIKLLPPARDDPAILDYDTLKICAVFKLTTEDVGDGTSRMHLEEAIAIKNQNGDHSQVGRTISLHSHFRNEWSSSFPLGDINIGDRRRPVQPEDMQKVTMLIDGMKSMKRRCIKMCRRWWAILDETDRRRSVRYLRRLFFYSAIRAEALEFMVNYVVDWVLIAGTTISGLGDALDRLNDKITELDRFGGEYAQEVIDCLVAVSVYPESEEMWVIPE